MPKRVVMDIDPLSLERQVCFALVVTNRAAFAVHRPLLEPLGLTYQQYLAMLALWDNAKPGGEPMTIKDIAGLLLQPAISAGSGGASINSGLSGRHCIWSSVTS